MIKNIVVDTNIINELKVVDVRLKFEWQHTGVIKDSLLISYYNNIGLPIPEKFLEELDKHVSKDEEFGIICRTGNRTSQIAQFLDEKGYSVINLDGGIVELEKQGYKFIKYNG